MFCQRLGWSFCLLVVLMGCVNTSVVREQTIYGSGVDMLSCDQITEQDIYELCLERYATDPEEFEAVLFTNRFHQHVGPNNVYGAKMALYAKRLLDGANHQMSVVSEAGTTPPLSCLNDGIMVAIGATFGRGLITTLPETHKLAATFRFENRSVRLEVKPEFVAFTQEYIADSLARNGGLTDEYFKDVRKMALVVWGNMSQEDLFIVSFPEHEGCVSTELNRNAYFNALHDLLHTTLAEEVILSFIDEHACVRNGSVALVDGRTVVRSTWISNGKEIVYTH